MQKIHFRKIKWKSTYQAQVILGQVYSTFYVSNLFLIMGQNRENFMCAPEPKIWIATQIKNSFHLQQIMKY